MVQGNNISQLKGKETKKDNIFFWRFSYAYNVHLFVLVCACVCDFSVLDNGVVLLGLGAAWNVADISKGSTVVIFGLGTVGLSVSMMT